MRKFEILGAGCPKCQKMAEHTKAAAEDLGLEYEIVKVTEINDIISYGVMTTPALVVDGEVKVMGKVPTAEEIKGLIG